MKLVISWIGFKIAVRIYSFSVACIPFIIWAESATVLEDFIFTISVLLGSCLRFFTENEKIRISIQKNGNVIYNNTIWCTVQNITLGLFLFATGIVIGEDGSERFCDYVFNSYRQAFLYIFPYILSCIRIGSAFNIAITFGDAIKMALHRWRPKKSKYLLAPTMQDLPTEVDPCVVCKENERKICLRCGHFILCFSCYNSVKKNNSRCPMCTVVFKEGIRVFKN